MVACIETERGPPCAAVDRHRRRVRAPSTLVESSPSSTFHTRKHSSHLYPLLYICIYKQINSKKERFVYICIQFSSGSRPCLPSSICLEQWKKKQSETRVSHMYIYKHKRTPIKQLFWTHMFQHSVSRKEIMIESMKQKRKQWERWYWQTRAGPRHWWIPSTVLLPSFSTSPSMYQLFSIFIFEKKIYIYIYIY